MAKLLPNLKLNIPDHETVFYVFQLSPSEYMLYDSAMGDPVAYGSLNKVAGKLANHCDKLNERRGENKPKIEIFVWKFVRDTIRGWKLLNTLNGIGYDTPKKGKVGAFAKVNPKSPLKDVGYSEVYFWFDAGKINYLYDSEMGSPIWFGDSVKMRALIMVHSKRHSFSVQLFQVPVKSVTPQWKMSMRYKMDAEDEKKVLEKTKAKETEQAKM